MNSSVHRTKTVVWGVTMSLMLGAIAGPAFGSEQLVTSSTATDSDQNALNSVIPGVGVGTPGPLPINLSDLGAMTVSKSSISLKDPAGQNIALKKVDGDGSGEDFYEGSTKSGEKVEVQVLSETQTAPLADPETLGSPEDPIDEVPVSGESDGYEVEVAAKVVSAADFKPMLAIASTATTVTIAAPDGTAVKNVISYDSSGIVVAQPANKTENSNGSITLPRAEAAAMFGVETEQGDETTQLTIPIGTPAAAKKNQWTEFYYTTFIPEKYVDVPTPCKATSNSWNVTKHNGNNRSWKNLRNGAAYESYKTVAGIKVDWSRGKVYNVAQVSVSKGYDASGNLKKKKQASARGIKTEQMQRTSSYVYWRMRHQVSNPLCPGAGAIRYTGTVKMYRSGTMKVSFNRVQVPNHEMYARTNLRGNWTNINRLSRKGFHCLAVPCGNNVYTRTVKLPIH